MCWLAGDNRFDIVVSHVYLYRTEQNGRHSADDVLNRFVKLTFLILIIKLHWSLNILINWQQIIFWFRWGLGVLKKAITKPNVAQFIKVYVRHLASTILHLYFTTLAFRIVIKHRLSEFKRHIHFPFYCRAPLFLINLFGSENEWASIEQLVYFVYCPYLQCVRVRWRMPRQTKISWYRLMTH